MALKFIDVKDINDIPKENWIRVQAGVPRRPDNTNNIIRYKGEWYHCSNWGSEHERDLGKPISDSEFFDIVSSWTDENPYYFKGPKQLCYW